MDKNKLAEQEYWRAKTYGFRTAWIAVLFCIVGFGLGVCSDDGGNGSAGALSVPLTILSLVTAIMLFRTNSEMESKLKVSLKRQIRICKTHFSVFATYLAIAALSGIDASTMATLSALSMMSFLVAPLYFKANTALDYAEE